MSSNEATHAGTATTDADDPTPDDGDRDDRFVALLDGALREIDDQALLSQGRCVDQLLEALEIAEACSAVGHHPRDQVPARAPSVDEDGGRTCATFVPYFLDGSPHTPNGSDAYIHVRLTGQSQRYGSLTVYLPNATALIVPVRDLVRLVPAGAFKGLGETLS